MKRRSPHRNWSTTAAGLLLAVGLLPVACGCQLNRSFFQMDSNSKVPFFGVDLAPKWPRRSSSVEGVSRLQSETAQQSGTTPQAETQNRRETTAEPAAESLPLSATVATPTSHPTGPTEMFR